MELIARGNTKLGEDPVKAVADGPVSDQEAVYAPAWTSFMALAFDSMDVPQLNVRQVVGRRAGFVELAV